jgi:ACR3 family arsenite efflux pump ArsB
MSVAHTAVAPPAPKRLDVFERYLSLWVALCIVGGKVPVMLSVCAFCDRTRDWFPADRMARATP